MEPIGAVLVGSDALLREGLARVLTTAEFKIMASRPRIDTNITDLIAQGHINLLIVDIADDFEAAIEQVAHFKGSCPSGRVAMLAHRHRLTEMLSAFRAGANAYFVKIATCEAFIKSLELVMLGETVLPSAILTILDDEKDQQAARRINLDEQDENDGHRRDYLHLRQTRFASCDDDENGMQEVGQVVGAYNSRLSARHKSILGCLIEGDSNKTIARKMSIAEATVKVHVKAILRRIHVHNRTQAAIWAVNSGLFLRARDVDGAAAMPASSPAFGVGVSPSALANGSSQVAETNGTRHVMLAGLDLEVRNVVHRSDG